MLRMIFVETPIKNLYFLTSLPEIGESFPIKNKYNNNNNIGMWIVDSGTYI
jgi:hypothetical protein